ncbi:hypothetical protein Tco_1308646, partial [Tanacetum coccineum]
YKLWCAVGADADEDRIPELIAPRRKKLSSVRSGGGGIAAAAETKKEEKVKEKEDFDYINNKDITVLSGKNGSKKSSLEFELHDLK